MAAKKKDAEANPQPVLRYAPLGELKVYPVYEHELDMLKQGTPGALFLNFALFLLPIGVTLIIALATTTITSNRRLVLLVLWWRGYKGSRDLVEQIKNRMPPPPSLQQLATETGTGEAPAPPMDK